jgi:zinc/manganese transport system ATP-binding protein
VATASGTRARGCARPLTDASVALEGVTQVVGDRELWRDLTLELQPAEFLAVLGPNGAGKTTLARLILGLVEPTTGRVLVGGLDARAARRRVGYVPQQRAFDRDLPLRGRDLVRLGLDGHRWGVGLRRGDDPRVAAAIAAVDAGGFADMPVGRVSGGEQQRLRIAQMLVQEPAVIVADEPLLSLDLAHQHNVIELLDRQRRERGTPIVFITHDVNPVLAHVDRVLYLTGEGAAVGLPNDVLTSETLSRLYRAPIDVLRVRGRVVVVGTPETDAHHHL